MSCKSNCLGCLANEYSECEHHEVVAALEIIVAQGAMLSRTQEATGDRIATALEALVKAAESIDGQLSTIDFTIRNEGKDNRY